MRNKCDGSPGQVFARSDILCSKVYKSCNRRGRRASMLALCEAIKARSMACEATRDATTRDEATESARTGVQDQARARLVPAWLCA